jgi:Zn-finger in Ran binding protein and others
MDENLFQLVTVGLLGVTLLVLLVTLLTLNKVNKRLDEGGGAPAESSHFRAEERHEEPAPSQAAAPAEPGVSEPVAQQAEPSVSEPVAQQAEPEVDREPARAEEPQPVAVAETPAQAQAATGFEDAPEEQPFERDGRWWFKRGDELLVYDEQSGQWEPAPAAPAAPSPARPAAPQVESWQQSGVSPPAGGQSEQAAQPAQEPGSFWKCPSCGAVNGSTATSCRMCFTPKP